MNKSTSFARGVSSKLKDIKYTEYTEEEYIQIANLLATSYDEELSYEVGDFVVYKDNTYECKEQILEGESFTESKWEYLCPYVLVEYPDEGGSTIPFDISAIYQYINDKTAAAQTTATTAATIANSANQTANSANQTAISANQTAISVETRANNGEFDGEDATELYISSSNGNVFKNNSINTVLTVVIRKGSSIITDLTGLVNEYGNDSYLQWYSKSENDLGFVAIPLDDDRISAGGFSLSITSSDVYTKTTFMCELIVQ